MDPALQKLISMEPPPVPPVAPGNPEAWLPVESRIGVVLPAHYKEYIHTYGAGQWANFFGIMNPFYQWKHPQAQDYFRWTETRLDTLDSTFHRENPKYYAPFHRYPAPNGLIPFGYDDNGGTLCFQVSGVPSVWPIILLDGKLSPRHDIFRGTIASFIVALLEESFLSTTWPADFFPIERPAFRPYTKE
jgi:hypothetical protein